MLDNNLAVFSEGEECSNDWGTFWVFTYQAGVLIPKQHSFQDFYFHLQAVNGIGLVREKALHKKGISSLAELANTPFCEDGKLVLAGLEAKNWPLIYRRFPRFMVLAALPRERITVLDIETAGFGFAMPIFLVGVITLTPLPQIKLFLARHPAEEAAMLKAVSIELERAEAVITYNGGSFDLPVLKKRASRWGLPFPKPLNLDLLPVVRKILGKEVPDCRLKTIEKIILKYERHLDPASGEIPLIYQKFLLAQEPKLLDEVISHNARDLESLILIWNYLDEREINKC